MRFTQRLIAALSAQQGARSIVVDMRLRPGQSGAGRDKPRKLHDYQKNSA
jgi:glutamine synthetase adenylyltransferase